MATRKWSQRIPVLLILSILIFSLLGLPVKIAHATTQLEVTTIVDEYDSGDPSDTACSLREAIKTLNDDLTDFGGCHRSQSDGFVIHLPSNASPYTLGIAGTSGIEDGDLNITRPMDINGDGVDGSKIHGADLYRVFNIQVSTIPVRLTGLKIEHGYSTNGGAGIYLESSYTGINNVLELQNVKLEHNHTTADGGAIYISNVSGNDTNVLMNNSTIRYNSANGSPEGPTQNGGGVYFYTGRFTVTNSEIFGNTAGDNGGGIWFGGTSYANSDMHINNSYFENNSASDGYGGNVFTLFDMTIVDSILKTGYASWGGGNIYTSTSSGKKFVAERTEISGGTMGTSGGGGGGIAVNGIMDLWHVTISGNTAWLGGGIYTTNNSPSYPVRLFYVTLANNSDGDRGAANIFTNGTSNPVAVHDTIIAGSGYLCNHSVSASSDYSIDNGTTCALPAGSGNNSNWDPGIATLADNGSLFHTGLLGATRHPQTHALLSPSSNAVDRGNPGCNTPYDQRAFKRPVDGDRDGDASCDIGAYELQLFSFLPLLVKP